MVPLETPILVTKPFAKDYKPCFPFHKICRKKETVRQPIDLEENIPTNCY